MIERAANGAGAGDRRIVELSYPVTYGYGPKQRYLTVSRLNLEMPATKKARRLGFPTPTIGYCLRLLSLMTGIPMNAIEDMDSSDFNTAIHAAYEVLRSYHARHGLSLPPMQQGNVQ